MHPSLHWTLALIPALCPSALAEVRADDLEVSVRGRSHELAELEQHVAAEHLDGALDQLELYREWILDNDYHVSMTEDGRVILVTSSKKVARRRMKLVERTLEAFDELMSPPDRAGSDEVFSRAAWGIGDHVPDQVPVVLVEVRKAGEYQDLLSGLGQAREDLSNLVHVHGMRPGFSEEQVTAAVWQEAPDGYELGTVWRSENELVNRLARLLVFRSYGPQPTWLSVGAAWNIELEVMRDIYCFPYRTGFVGIGDHGGWETELKREFKKRKKDPLALDEFAGWRRNTWDEHKAQLAFGMVEYLSRHEPEVLSRAAEAFRLQYKEGFKTTHPDGSWETNPAYQVPVEEQLDVLVDASDAELLGRATEFMTRWNRYRPRRRR
ncbi:MAG: hypothetical protein PVJ89_14230 [Planctomycetota bacterium]|jgi:hypothetical protein